NKLKKLTFNMDCNLVELQASDNEFEEITNIFSKIKEEDKFNYFNINNNKISGGKLSDFAKFKNLMTLSIGNKENKGEDQGNKFTGSLENLEYLEKLEELDIRNNGIEVDEEFLKN